MGLSLSLSICWSQKLRIIRTAFSPLDILCHVAPFTPRCYLSEPTSALPPALPFERQLSIRPLPMASSSHTIKRRRLESVCEDVGWTARSWLESADVLSRLAEVLLACADAAETNQQLALRQLGTSVDTEQQLAQKLRDGGACEKLASELLPRLKELASDGGSDSGGASAESKFQGTLQQLSFGGLYKFYAGLEGLVGSPNPNVCEAMREEHMLRPDSHLQFVASNYRIQSTSAIEWAFVVEPTDEALRRLGDSARHTVAARGGEVRVETPAQA